MKRTYCADCSLMNVHKPAVKKETLINLRNFSRKFHSAPRFLSIISVMKIRQTARLDSRDNAFSYSESTLFRMSASGTMAFFASCTVLV